MSVQRTMAIGAAIGLAVLWPDAAFAQCAMCRRVLASPEGQQLVAAFRSGILLLLVAPFAVFATVARLAIRGQRRRNAGLEQPDPSRDFR
jgi:hypothetical protein